MVEPGRHAVLVAWTGRFAGTFGVWDVDAHRWVQTFYDELARDRAWLLWDKLENFGSIPFWRRATPLWLILHVLVGLLIGGFVAAMLGSAVLALMGSGADETGKALGWLALGWLGPLAGWLTFVYARSLRERILALAAGGLAGVVGWVLSAVA